MRQPYQTLHYLQKLLSASESRSPWLIKLEDNLLKFGEMVALASGEMRMLGIAPDLKHRQEPKRAKAKSDVDLAKTEH